MDSADVKKLLEAVRSGRITTEGALKKLKHLPYENLCFAKVDHHRHLRQGIPEVVFAEGKTIEDVIAISHALYKKSRKVLITKASEEIFNRLKMKKTVFHALSRTIAVNGEERKRGHVLILSAGTSDIPVAEEAAVTASFLGSKVEVVYDVGGKLKAKVSSHKKTSAYANEGKIIEKLFEGGRAALDPLGVPVESLACITKMEDGKIEFRD